MKKSIVASIIGVVATVAAVESSYGQGYVAFNNYYSAVDQTVRDISQGGALLGSTYTAQLYYSFGGGPLTALGASNGGVVAFNTGGAPAGYFIGGVATIPGYSSGPITFQVAAFTGGPDYLTATTRGLSGFLDLAGIATGTSPVGDLGPNLTAFTVQIVPEPSTLALIGLGTGALLFLRRRK
jgi:hypothetical protein